MKIIKSPRLIIISDTHIGSIYERLDYLDLVYKYALDKEIPVVIHTGDLIQSTYRNVNKKYRDEEHQIQHLLETYPQIKDIETKILLGNHDYNTIRKDPKYLHMIEERVDFEVLGIRRAYIKWDDDVLSLYHRCPKYQIYIPNLEYTLQFCGHAHKLMIKEEERKLLVPSLSDDMKDDGVPSFLQISHEDGSIRVESLEIGEMVPRLVYTYKKK